MQALATSVPLGEAASILGSAWTAGASASLSLFAIPAILQGNAPTDVAVRQWYAIYNRGKAIPAIGGIAALSSFYVAYGHWAYAREFRGYLAGGIMTMGLVPFTIALIHGTNRKLMADMDGTGKRLGEDEVAGLLRKWMNLNYVRWLLPMAGSVLGLWNMLVLR